MAMPAHKLNTRKLSQLTTTGLGRTTACKYCPNLDISNEEIKLSFLRRLLLLNIKNLLHFFFLLHFRHSTLREQWIRAKYERTEFTGETKYPPIPYTTGEASVSAVIPENKINNARPPTGAEVCRKNRFAA